MTDAVSVATLLCIAGSLMTASAVARSLTGMLALYRVTVKPVVVSPAKPRPVGPVGHEASSKDGAAQSSPSAPSSLLGTR